MEPSDRSIRITRLSDQGADADPHHHAGRANRNDVATRGWTPGPSWENPLTTPGFGEMLSALSAENVELLAAVHGPAGRRVPVSVAQARLCFRTPHFLRCGQPPGGSRSRCVRGCARGRTLPRTIQSCRQAVRRPRTESKRRSTDSTRGLSSRVSRSTMIPAYSRGGNVRMSAKSRSSVTTARPSRWQTAASSVSGRPAIALVADGNGVVPEHLPAVPPPRSVGSRRP